MDNKKSRGPTPYLHPRSKNQMWTEQETRLLDQITLEISEAWAKDLKVMREYHKEIKSTIEDLNNQQDSVIDFCDNLYVKFPKLEEFVNSDKITKLFNFIETQEEIKFRLQDMHTKILNLENLLIDSRSNKPSPKPVDLPKKSTFDATFESLSKFFKKFGAK